MERLNTSFTIFRDSMSEIHIASGDALRQNQTKHMRSWNMIISMHSINVKEANAYFKICKSLGINQGYGCKNGLIAKVYLVPASGTGGLYS